MSRQVIPPVQCSTGPLWALELEQAMDVVAAAGFEELELMVTRDPKTQDAGLPLRLAGERGMRIASLHGPFLAISKTVWGMDPVEKVKRGIDMCKAIGADTYIVHPPLLWERDFAGWVREHAAELGAREGVTIAVETMYPKWVAGRRLRAHRWLEPEELVEECPTVAIDTSHLAVAREDILEAYELLFPKLVHVHLSNNAGDGRDGHLELEKGVLPLERLLAELVRTRYAGTISLELSVRAYLGRPRAMIDMLERNREFVERRLTVHEKVEKGLPRGRAT